MGRYLVLWEEEPAHTPADVQERLAIGQVVMQAALQGIEAGIIKEFGAMLGLHKGFGVYEGSEAEVSAFLQQFAPWYRSEVHAVISARELTEIAASLTQ